MPEPNPTVRQRELGMRLRELRGARGLTVEDVAQQLLCSPPKISRIETGARRASLRDVRDLCALYGLEQQAMTELMDLARQARQPGWWAAYDDLALDPYIGFEQEAISITTFSMNLVPGLLQTEEYARASFGASARKMDTFILDQRVEARLMRQRILTRERPPRYRALLDEVVLHRQVGAPTVMINQLDKLVSLSERDLATVQIVPFTVGAHGITDSNFDFFEFGDGGLRPVVYVEGLVSKLYQERPSDIRTYHQAIEDLRDIALIPGDSLKLIEKIRKVYASQ